MLSKIVLPEAEDRRVLEAAATTLKEGNAKVVLLGAKEDIEKLGEGLDLTGATIVNPKTSDKLDAYVAKLVELREKKGMTPELALQSLTTDYTTFAVMMVKMGDADGVVSGLNMTFWEI